MTAKPKTFELVGDVDMFVPSSTSDNLAHQNAVAQNPAHYDGVTLDVMANNPSYTKGFDPIDMATLCRDSLVKNADVNNEHARNYTEAVRRVLSGSQQKNRFSAL